MKNRYKFITLVFFFIMGLFINPIPGYPVKECPIITPENPVITPDNQVIIPENPVIVPESQVIVSESSVITPEIPVIIPEIPVVITPESPVIIPDDPVDTIPPIINVGELVSFILTDNEALDKYSINDNFIEFEEKLKEQSLIFADIESYLRAGENTLIVFDSAGNTSSYTFTFEIPATIKTNHVYYKSDRGELAWKTGTTPENPTTSMTIRFTVESTYEVAAVRVLWTNSFNSPTSFADLKESLLLNPNQGIELTKAEDGYYYTNSPKGIVGRYLAGLVVVDIKGNVYAWNGYDMYFVNLIVDNLFNTPEYLPYRPSTLLLAVDSLSIRLKLKVDDIVEIKYAWSEKPLFSLIKKGQFLELLKDFEYIDGKVVISEPLTDVEGQFYLTVYAKNSKGEIMVWGGDKIYVKKNLF